MYAVANSRLKACSVSIGTIEHADMSGAAVGWAYREQAQLHGRYQNVHTTARTAVSTHVQTFTSCHKQ